MRPAASQHSPSSKAHAAPAPHALLEALASLMALAIATGCWFAAKSLLQL